MFRVLIEKTLTYTAFGLYYDEDTHLGNNCSKFSFGEVDRCIYGWKFSDTSP